MKANVIRIPTDLIIKILDLPEDTAIINVKRNETTLDFNITIQNSECTEMVEGAYLLHKIRYLADSGEAVIECPSCGKDIDIHSHYGVCDCGKKLWMIKKSVFMEGRLNG